MVRLLLEKYNAKIEKDDSYNFLSSACGGGSLKIIKLLIEHDLEIRFKDSLLMQASKKGHKDIIKFLLEEGANINSKCSSKGTPLRCIKREI